MIKNLKTIVNKNDFKNRQKEYFAVSQPHLTPKISNYTRKLTDKVISELNILPEHRMLEVGCGSGRFTLALSEKLTRLTGIDYSDFLIKELKSLNIEGLEVVNEDIDEFEPKEKFDRVVGFFILHHLSDLKKSLESVAGLTKKGGVVGFVEPNPLNLLYYIQPFVSKNMSWGEEKGFLDMQEDKLKNAFEQAGFVEFGIKRFGFFPPFVINNSIGQRIDSKLEKIKLWEKLLPYQLIHAKVR